MKRFFKGFWNYKLETIYMLIVLVCIVVIIVLPVERRIKNISFVSLTSVFIVYLLDIVICIAIDKKASECFCNTITFDVIDDKYNSKKIDIDSVLSVIHEKYAGIRIKTNDEPKAESDKKNQPEVTIAELLNRSAELKYKISWPELKHESVSILLPLFCTAILALPELIGGCRSRFKPVGMLAAIVVVLCITILIALFLSKKKVNRKSELMNYELKQVEKMILEYQENSISKIKAYKEKKANESK